MKSPLELKAAVTSPGFTPSTRDAAALVALLEDTDSTVRSAVEVALSRLGDALIPIARERWDAAPSKARIHLVRALSRVASVTLVQETCAVMLRALEDDSPHVRRSAARALGKVRGELAIQAEQALVLAWKREGVSVEEQRAYAAALGTLGAESALELLSAVGKADPELSRIAGRSRLMIERTRVRETAGGIDGAVAPEVPMPIVFHVRRGLEPILADELEGAWGPLTVGEGQVRGMLHGPLESAWKARTALSFALILEEADTDVVTLLTSDRARSLLTRWTRGPIRYRLAFASGGHQRARVWQIARDVAERCPELINDPTASIWEVLIREPPKGPLSLELSPRALEDPRFSYRVRDVPAASHPTIAAALVRIGGVRERDVVWDPFVGSGLELVERARLGKYAALFGTDLEPKALDAARANLDSAKVSATLSVADATKYTPPPTSGAVTLIVTNPPMGLRVARTKELATMLEQFLVHASEVLAAGGRLVWLNPIPERTRQAIRALPLDLELVREVDMGGFWASLQVLQKRKSTVRRIVHR